VLAGREGWPVVVLRCKRPHGVEGFVYIGFHDFPARPQ